MVSLRVSLHVCVRAYAPAPRGSGSVSEPERLGTLGAARMGSWGRATRRNTFLVVRWLPRHIYHRLCSPVTMSCRRRGPSVTSPSIAIAAPVLGGPESVRARARVVLNSSSARPCRVRVDFLSFWGGFPIRYVSCCIMMYLACILNASCRIHVSWVYLDVSQMYLKCSVKFQENTCILTFWMYFTRISNEFKIHAGYT